MVSLILLRFSELTMRDIASRATQLRTALRPLEERAEISRRNKSHSWDRKSFRCTGGVRSLLSANLASQKHDHMRLS